MWYYDIMILIAEKYCNVRYWIKDIFFKFQGWIYWLGKYGSSHGNESYKKWIQSSCVWCLPWSSKSFWRSWFYFSSFSKNACWTSWYNYNNVTVKVKHYHSVWNKKQITFQRKLSAYPFCTWWHFIRDLVGKIKQAHGWVRIRQSYGKVNCEKKLYLWAKVCLKFLFERATSFSHCEKL